MIQIGAVTNVSTAGADDPATIKDRQMLLAQLVMRMCDEIPTLRTDADLILMILYVRYP